MYNNKNDNGLKRGLNNIINNFDPEDMLVTINGMNCSSFFLLFYYFLVFIFISFIDLYYIKEDFSTRQNVIHKRENFIESHRLFLLDL